MTCLKKQFQVLIIDDHPLITEAYKSAFLYIENQDEGFSFYIDVCHDCDSGNQKIENFASHCDHHCIIFLDISLPPSRDGKILSGEDLGLRINSALPKAKVIVSTTFNDNYRVHSIFKNINPDGFLIKNDITPKELVHAINEVISDPPYYSKSVMKLLRNQVSSNLLLDDIDRRILYELSIGTRTSDLQEIVFLSSAGIQKRKRQMEHIFGITHPNDRELILAAREKGFI